MERNIDDLTVSGFGDEWSRFDQSNLNPSELHSMFKDYFHIFPWNALPDNAVGFDLGCGSGRWAKCVAPKVGRLHCIDASRDALAVAKLNLSQLANCEFHNVSVHDIPLANESMDFGYSLGVLHHVPDTVAGIQSCVDKLKKGAPFLVYLYYSFDNRPRWFRLIWRVSDFVRKFVSVTPHWLRYWLSQIIAAFVYFPLARLALLFEKLDLSVGSFPLSAYRRSSFYTMRTDALDRFGTRLEKRFSARQIREMMERAGLERIEFSNSVPYWCAVGYKK